MPQEAQTAAYDKAKDTLTHYFSTLFESQGLKWTDENHQEVSKILDGVLSEVEARVDQKIQEAINSLSVMGGLNT